jgi:2-amino-4-hydroxy-6-hydroxymethyldihydropteridine diphosphokinase
MPRTVIAIGGNQESTAAAINNALNAFRLDPQLNVLQSSNVYRSDPMGIDAGGRFLNAACLLESNLSAPDLLDLLQQVETDNDRIHETHWGPRTLDLDVIFYGDQILSSERLTVPHPHCWYRRFVLDPVAEICPEWVHPAIGTTVADLRDRLHAEDFRVAVSGDVDPETLASEFRQQFPGVRFENVTETTCPPAEGLGILVSDEPRELPPLWLRTTSLSLEPFVRDVLTAARGQCHRLAPG